MLYIGLFLGGGEYVPRIFPVNWCINIVIKRSMARPRMLQWTPQHTHDRLSDYKISCLSCL